MLLYFTDIVLLFVMSESRPAYFQLPMATALSTVHISGQIRRCWTTSRQQWEPPEIRLDPAKFTKKRSDLVPSLLMYGLNHGTWNRYDTMNLNLIYRSTLIVNERSTNTVYRTYMLINEKLFFRLKNEINTEYYLNGSNVEHQIENLTNIKDLIVTFNRSTTLHL